MENIDKFITAEELAPLLRVAISTVYAKVRSRQLPHYRIGDRVVFKLSEVLASARVPVESEFENFKVPVGGRR